MLRGTDERKRQFAVLMMARRSFAKNIIFIELEEILREEYFAWIYFNVEIILILFDIYIYIYTYKN